MKTKIVNTVILVLFFIAAGIIVVMKNKNSEALEVSTKDVVTQSQRPKLLDLGSHSCVPCKMMMPVLDTLRNTYADQLEVEFIDVWQDREAGSKYGVKAIPTQIIYDVNGNELFRHEGFWSRKDIEEKMAELGITLRGES